MLEVVETVLEPRLVAPVVVAHESTERIEARTTTGSDDYLVTIGELVDCTLSHVELNLEAVALDGSDVIFVHCTLQLVASNYGVDSRLHASSLHGQLLLELGIALLSPRHVVAEEELHLYEVLATSLERCKVVGEAVCSLLTCGQCHAGTLHGLVLLDALTILPE